ncbi:MAG: holo-ACP synthase [Bacilli bacterium]|nr:holo-ACP synthase [Bacilli bacterium]MBR4672124.1 holo-ACP synthase [Bacilli bacterium]
MYSVGIDLLNNNRFEKIKENETFMNNTFTEQEIEYIKSKDNYNGTIAGIFCSKEAFLKAIKKGINNYSLKDIEIIHDENNAPYIVLHNELNSLYANNNISVSISHDDNFTTSIVLIEL